MNTETETPAEYGSDKPVGDVGEVVAGLQKLMSYHEDLMDRDRAPIHVAISALQSQARENAALESTIEGLELDIEGYQQKSQELKDESILSDIAFDQMQSDIETLTAENATLKQRWISVDDRMPEDTKAVLVWVSDNMCHYAATFRPSGEWSSWQGSNQYWWCKFITHWMPLPAPPNSRNAEAARIRGEK